MPTLVDRGLCWPAAAAAGLPLACRRRRWPAPLLAVKPPECLLLAVLPWGCLSLALMALHARAGLPRTLPTPWNPQQPAPLLTAKFPGVAPADHP